MSTSGTTTTYNVSDVTGDDDTYPMTTEVQVTIDTGDNRLIELYSRIMNLFIVSTYLPLLIVGLSGNSLSFYLMWGRARTSSTYNYLCSLCVADNFYLTVSVTGWLISFFFGFDARKEIDCNVIYLLNRIPKHVSAWLLVAISLERTLVVFLPTKARLICNVKAARITILCICLTMCALNWVTFGGYKTLRGKYPYGVNVCPSRTDAIEWWNAKVNTWIRTSLYAYIPTVALFVTNIAMAVRFTLASHQNKVNAGQTTDATGTGSTSAGSGGKGKTSGRTMAKYSRRMTITALVLSLSFLLFTLPQAIHQIWFSLNGSYLRRHLVEFYKHFMIRNMLLVLAHTNHAVNFILYCLTSASFRRNMILLVTCRKRWGGSSVGTTMDGSTVGP